MAKETVKKKDIEAEKCKMSKREKKELNDLNRGSFSGCRPVIFDDKRKKRRDKDTADEIRKYI